MDRRYPFSLTLKFKSEGDLQNFLRHWVAEGGDSMANMTTVCDPEIPSWHQDPPFLCIASMNDADLLEEFDHAFLTGFATRS